MMRNSIKSNIKPRIGLLSNMSSKRNFCSLIHKIQYLSFVRLGFKVGQSLSQFSLDVRLDLVADAPDVVVDGQSVTCTSTAHFFPLEKHTVMLARLELIIKKGLSIDDGKLSFGNLFLVFLIMTYQGESLLSLERSRIELSNLTLSKKYQI